MRSPNGEGQSPSFLTTFNLDDDVERAAYEMARQLARPHGRRKHVIVALLYGLYLYQERTGIELNADTVMAMAMNGQFFTNSTNVSSTPPRQIDSDSGIKISTANKGSAEDITRGLLNSFNLFD